MVAAARNQPEWTAKAAMAGSMLLAAPNKVHAGQAGAGRTGTRGRYLRNGVNPQSPRAKGRL